MNGALRNSYGSDLWSGKNALKFKMLISDEISVLTLIYLVNKGLYGSQKCSEYRWVPGIKGRFKV